MPFKVDGNVALDDSEITCPQPVLPMLRNTSKETLASTWNRGVYEIDEFVSRDATSIIGTVSHVVTDSEGNNGGITPCSVCRAGDYIYTKIQTLDAGMYTSWVREYCISTGVSLDLMITQDEHFEVGCGGVSFAYIEDRKILAFDGGDYLNANHEIWILDFDDMSRTLDYTIAPTNENAMDAVCTIKDNTGDIHLVALGIQNNWDAYTCAARYWHKNYTDSSSWAEVTTLLPLYWQELSEGANFGYQIIDNQYIFRYWIALNYDDYAFAAVMSKFDITTNTTTYAIFELDESIDDSPDVYTPRVDLINGNIYMGVEWIVGNPDWPLTEWEFQPTGMMFVYHSSTDDPQDNTFVTVSSVLHAYYVRYNDPSGNSIHLASSGALISSHDFGDGWICSMVDDGGVYGPCIIYYDPADFCVKFVGVSDGVVKKSTEILYDGNHITPRPYGDFYLLHLGDCLLLINADIHASEKYLIQ